MEVPLHLEKEIKVSLIYINYSMQSFLFINKSTHTHTHIHTYTHTSRDKERER